jgi:hypothetical protein
MKWIRLAVAATSLLAVAIVPTTMGIASAVPPRAPTVPKLEWRACDSGFQCSTARVPLDYRHPGGAKISLALVRHLAPAKAGRRLGTMFVNLGGPMDQAIRTRRLGRGGPRAAQRERMGHIG